MRVRRDARGSKATARRESEVNLFVCCHRERHVSLRVPHFVLLYVRLIHLSRYFTVAGPYLPSGDCAFVRAL